MNNRICELRKALKLNQTEFGRSIGITTSGISDIEVGRRAVQERHIKLILSAYPDVSEKWLREGIGEMFVTSRNLADELAKKYSFPDITRKMLIEYEKLGEDQQAAVLEYATKFVASIVGDAAIEEEVAAYRQELIDQKEKESSASETGNEDMVG